MRSLTITLAVSLLAISGVAYGDVIQTYEINSFTGTLSSITFTTGPLAGVSTGPIVLSLDGSQPATLSYDYTTGTVSDSFTADVDVTGFGKTLTMQFSESGSFVIDSGTGLPDATMTMGSGISSPYSIAMITINNNWNSKSSSTSGQVAGTWAAQMLLLDFPAGAAFGPAPQLFVFDTANGNTAIGTFTASPIPEPAEFLPLAGALLGLTAWRRRKWFIRS